MKTKLDKWIEKNTTSLSGKTVAISGATGGIGIWLCRHAAALGASLILLDRNQEKSNSLKKELMGEFPSLSVSLIRLDLSDIKCVAQAAEELKKIPLDALILNAGAYAVPRFKCSTGLDNVFQINFAAPYYLARELAPHLRERGGRVVAVGSIAHNYSRTDENDVDFSTRKKASLVYGNAKRYLMFALGEIFCDGECAVVHPGITFTNITAHYPPLIFAIIKHPMKIIFMHPKKAALSIVRGLFEHTGRNEWIGPRLFDVWGLPKKKCLSTCSDEERSYIAKKAEQIYSEIKSSL
jgi:NAD(P)-dependent dehydrogenase (short-subunit alcohol dehydrogenase family)